MFCWDRQICKHKLWDRLQSNHSRLQLTRAPTSLASEIFAWIFPNCSGLCARKLSQSLHKNEFIVNTIFNFPEIKAQSRTFHTRKIYFTCQPLRQYWWWWDCHAGFIFTWVIFLLAIWSEHFSNQFGAICQKSLLWFVKEVMFRMINQWLLQIPKLLSLIYKYKYQLRDSMQLIIDQSFFLPVPLA